MYESHCEKTSQILARMTPQGDFFSTCSFKGKQKQKQIPTMIAMLQNFTMLIKC